MNSKSKMAQEDFGWLRARQAGQGGNGIGPWYAGMRRVAGVRVVHEGLGGPWSPPPFAFG